MWGDTAGDPAHEQQLTLQGANVTRNNNVQGGEPDIELGPYGGWMTWSEGNIDADPLFVDPDGPDDDPYTWEENDFHLQLSPTVSPSIDTGNANAVPGTLDLEQAPRMAGCAVDMGAHESAEGRPDCPDPPPGGECYADLRADFNADGVIDAIDEAYEELQPLFLAVNSDDDNYNEIPDKDEAPVAGEDDLAELRLLAPNCDFDDPTEAWWSISWADPDPPTLLVWLAPDKSDGLGGPAMPIENNSQNVWPPPQSVWLEALRPIDLVDITFTVFDPTGGTVSTAAGGCVASAGFGCRRETTIPVTVAPCSPALERYWIRAAQSGDVTSAEAVIDASTGQMSPLCAEGTTASDGLSAIWVGVDRFPIERWLWVQTGYYRETFPGAITASEYVYTEINWGPNNDQNIENDHPHLSFGRHRLWVQQLVPECGCWIFLYDDVEFHSYENSFWAYVSGTRAVWATEIYNLEDRMCGSVGDPCRFSSCAYGVDWASPAPTSLTDGDIIFHPPSPGPSEWGKQRVSPTAFNVWDRYP